MAQNNKEQKSFVKWLLTHRRIVFLILFSFLLFALIMITYLGTYLETSKVLFSPNDGLKYAPRKFHKITFKPNLDTLLGHCEKDGIKIVIKPYSEKRIRRWDSKKNDYNDYYYLAEEYFKPEYEQIINAAKNDKDKKLLEECFTLLDGGYVYRLNFSYEYGEHQKAVLKYWDAFMKIRPYGNAYIKYYIPETINKINFKKLLEDTGNDDYKKTLEECYTLSSSNKNKDDEIYNLKRKLTNKQKFNLYQAIFRRYKLYTADVKYRHVGTRLVFDLAIMKDNNILGSYKNDIKIDSNMKAVWNFNDDNTRFPDNQHTSDINKFESYFFRSGVCYPNRPLPLVRARSPHVYFRVKLEQEIPNIISNTPKSNNENKKLEKYLFFSLNADEYLKALKEFNKIKKEIK